MNGAVCRLIRGRRRVLGLCRQPGTPSSCPTRDCRPSAPQGLISLVWGNGWGYVRREKRAVPGSPGTTSSRVLEGTPRTRKLPSCSEARSAYRLRKAADSRKVSVSPSHSASASASASHCLAVCLCPVQGSHRQAQLRECDVLCSTLQQSLQACFFAQGQPVPACAEPATPESHGYTSCAHDTGPSHKGGNGRLTDKQHEHREQREQERANLHLLSVFSWATRGCRALFLRVCVRAGGCRRAAVRVHRRPASGLRQPHTSLIRSPDVGSAPEREGNSTRNRKCVGSYIIAMLYSYRTTTI